MSITWARTSSYIDRQNAASVVGYGTITLDDTYIEGGWALTKATVNKNITTINHYSIEPVTGFDIKWDHANGKLIAHKEGYSNSDAETLLLTYAADPSGETALYVDPAGFLNSANAGTADVSFELQDGGSTAQCVYAASPTGVQVYCDDDAAYGAKLQCVSPTGHDIAVPTSSGTFIVVKHDADAATNGVAVYINDDATNAYERILCSVLGDADVEVELPTMPVDALDGAVLKLKYEAI